MPKRKSARFACTTTIKKIRLRQQLTNAPEVNSIAELIALGNTNCYYKNIDVIMLWKIVPYLTQLNNMVGMKDLKHSILYQILYYLQGMHVNNKNEEYLHTIIMGPPGTGKTTVAKIVAKIYQSLNILSESGTFKIAYRDDFIAEYLGQTAVKTRNLLNSCIGGVLFIDEFYALGPGQKDRDSFSKEALDTLTAFLSEHKNDFCCIAAGYKTDIQRCIFNANKGLRRRFTWVHEIVKYTPTELTLIFLNQLKSHHKWSLDVPTDQITKLIHKNKKLFEFAGGDIETFITKCKMVHAKRTFHLDQDQRMILNGTDLDNGLEMVRKYKLTDTDKGIPGMYL